MTSFEKPEQGPASMKDLTAAAEAARVPGTENFRPAGEGPVGAKAIEAAGFIGHDNEERDTERQKRAAAQDSKADASDTREIPPSRLG